MLGEFKAFLTGARLVVALAVVAAAVAGGAVAAWRTPVVGAAARISAERAEGDKWHAAYLDWHAYGSAEKAAFDASERLRLIEHGAASAAVSGLDAQCAARIAAARQSAAAISRIITKEPTYDPAGCPVRRLVDPGELRDALKPAAGAGR